MLSFYLFFFLINTVFICLLSVKPWANHFPQTAWGGTGKGTPRAKETREKELWEVERAPSHSEEEEKGCQQAKEPHGLREGKAQDGIGEEQLLQRRAPVIANDESPKHSPHSSSEASHLYCGSSSSKELGCWVYVPWNGTGVEAVARSKWGGQGMGLPSCCGSHLSVSLVVLAPLQTVISSVV